MSTPDWTAIEGDYRGTSASLRALASRHGTSEAGIRRMAKKHGWIRDATGTKRRIVADRLAGVTQSPTQCVKRNIEDEANQDVNDMRDGLTGYRNILRAMVQASSEVTEPRDAKVIAEALDKAVSGIRTIRGLDDPKDQKFEDLDAEIEAELAKLGAEKEARHAAPAA